jgi:cell division protein FtsI/penicillin-binding protein 2
VVRDKMLNLTEEQLEALSLAMADVVSARGTAGASALQGITIAGKTGTAQNSQDPDRSHAWFLGYAPAEEPTIVVGVFVEFGKSGSIAARLASRVIEAYLKQPALPVPVTDEAP